MSGVLLQQLDAVPAVLGVDHLHLVPLQHAGEREDVAHVVVHDQHLPAGERGIGPVELLQHLPLASGRLRLDPVQEERGLVEQPLRRAARP